MWTCGVHATNARHCALGVAGAEEVPGTFVEDQETGAKYFYAELTPEGWSLGQLPPNYHAAALEAIEVVARA